ncbi:MAG: sigma-70 family RNA polymerase sigma factor [Candidatus Omnitrophota bacterium]|jgi:RNA polymerase sigma-70 factor (ECF subfamily)
MDEKEFLQRCLKQDKAAWDEFVEKYSRLIYNYIFSVFKIKGLKISTDTANDLFQEVFLSLIKDNFHKLRQFKGKNNASLASWLRIITINFALDYFKKERQTQLSLDEELTDEGFSLKDILADGRMSAKQLLSDQERLEHLFECIDSLSAQDRYFLEMHIYQGINLRDLQNNMGLSRSAVDMRKFRLIQKLKDCFKDKGFQLES